MTGWQLRRAILATCLSLLVFAGPLSPGAGASQETGITPRVIGGTIAPPGSWPSQTALLFSGQADPFQAQFCGGTLIEEGWVLTAAHCVDFLPSPADLDVATGINDLNAIASSDRKTVSSISIHPDWNSVYDWDFALLELAAPSGDPTTELIAPAEVGETAAGRPARIAGWGCTVIGSRDDCRAFGFLPQLQEASIAFVSDSNCTTSWPTNFDAVMMICAGIYPAGGIDTCIGDSGGPLTAVVDGRRVLAGITSWGGLPCGLPSSPGVYSRVLAARDWILTTTSSEYWLEVARVGTGQGTVTSAPAGIACGASCAAKFTAGQTIELTASPAPGSTFTGWSGACTGTGTCRVTVDQGRDVAATFTANIAPTPQPPAPTAPTVTITSKPAKRTANRTATFRFRVSVPGSSFACRLNGKGWQRCSSPRTYRNLKRGRNHTFQVRATSDGMTGSAALYRWFVKRR